MRDDDWAVLDAFARDRAAIRRRLDAAARAELDDLLAHLAAVRRSPLRAEAIGDEIVLLLRRRLPSGDAVHASRPTASGQRIDDLLPSLLAPEPAPPSTAAALWTLAVEQIRAAPALSPAELQHRFHQDPELPHLIRLRRADGAKQLPSFQFDQAGTPIPIVLTINEMLEAERDPWGVAGWWLQYNVWLEAAPAQALGRLPDSELIAAARNLSGTD